MSVAAARHLVLLGISAPRTLRICRERPEFLDWDLVAIDSAEGCAALGHTAANAQLLLLTGDNATETDPHPSAEEATLRALLHQTGLGYSVVSQSPEGWLPGVLAACGFSQRSAALTQRRWTCESCSDPDCEHRLFQELLASKSN